jgi:hypothetical protein
MPSPSLRLAPALPKKDDMTVHPIRRLPANHAVETIAFRAANPGTGYVYLKTRDVDVGLHP